MARSPVPAAFVPPPRTWSLQSLRKIGVPSSHRGGPCGSFLELAEGAFNLQGQLTFCSAHHPDVSRFFARPPTRWLVPAL